MYERVAEAIGQLEDQSKDGSYKAGNPTYSKSRERQDRESAANSQGLCVEDRFFHE
jgi:hypothetical protein